MNQNIGGKSVKAGIGGTHGDDADLVNEFVGDEDGGAGLGQPAHQAVHEVCDLEIKTTVR